MDTTLDPAALAQMTVVARRLARAGGDAILAAAAEGPAGREANSKGIRRDLVTVADGAAERAVVGGLLREFPDHAVLAEEGALTPKGAPSVEADYVWIVDPLDGTTNYVHGLPYFATAIALVERGVPVLGVVHAPALQRTYSAFRGGGAFCDDEELSVTATPALADGLIATGFSYVRDEPGRDDNLARLGRALHRCRDLRRYGSAELDLCMTAAGQLDGYWEVHLAPWDVAAGGVIVREAGGRVTDLCGGDDWIYGESVLASNGALHAELLEVVGGPLPA